MTEAEREELAVRKRREEGTPVNDSTFSDWWAKFQEEQSLIDGASEKAKDDDDGEKLTGFQIFSEKAGVFSLEKLEAAAEELENDEEFGEVDEDLFDDDEDLDDLDFDDDIDDDSEEEPDI